MDLDGSKATPTDDISVDILKSNVDIHLPYITKSINLSIEKGCFLEELKLAEVRPIFGTKDDLDKENYRPVSVLLHVSKIITKTTDKSQTSHKRVQTSPRRLQKSHRRVIDDYRRVTDESQTTTDESQTSHRRVTNDYRRVTDDYDESFRKFF